MRRDEGGASAERTGLGVSEAVTSPCPTQHGLLKQAFSFMSFVPPLLCRMVLACRLDSTNGTFTLGVTYARWQWLGSGVSRGSIFLW